MILLRIRHAGSGRREPESYLRVFLDEAGELLLEARQTAAAVEKLLGAAGPGRCDCGSMSSAIVSPSLPQVERVTNSVPSVILTLMVW